MDTKGDKTMELEFFTPCKDLTIFLGDCLDILPQIAKQNIKFDLILSDPPFGTTNCTWDKQIEFESMWNSLDVVSESNTPILLFCQQPFTSSLGFSNIKNLKYSWIWEKTQGTGHLNAKKMPLKCHEDILVFYKKLPYYNPIKTKGHTRKVVKAKHKEKCEQGDIYNKINAFTDYDSTERYPRNVVKYKTDKQLNYLHPTQKPIELLEYFIKTYTKEGGHVLDFCMGSGSTGIACKNLGRKFTGIEINESFYNTAALRLTNENH